MKILYVGRFGTDSSEAKVAWALNNLEHNVIRLDRKDPVVGHCVAKYRPDLVLLSKAEPPRTHILLSQCHQAGVPTACWNFDLYFGFRTRFPGTFRANYLFTTDGGHDKEFRERGFRHHLLRQGIHLPYYRICDEEPKYDVAFVGGSGRYYHPFRNRLIAFLGRTYRDRFLHIRNDYGMRLTEKLREVKVVVGDSYPSRNYWSNRIYEITGRGCCFVHPNTPGLDTEFTTEEVPQYSRFDDWQSLKDTVDRLVGEDAVRDCMRRRAWKRCRSYTYTKRVEQLLHTLDA